MQTNDFFTTDICKNGISNTCNTYRLPTVAESDSTNFFCWFSKMWKWVEPTPVCHFFLLSGINFSPFNLRRIIWIGR